MINTSFNNLIYNNRFLRLDDYYIYNAFLLCLISWFAK
jgi:hypothetical protein